MNYNRPLGLHLRLTDSLYSLITQAESYNINALQFFLTTLPTGKYLKLKDENIDGFLQVKNKSFKNSYIHSSYWINLTTSDTNSLQASINLLKKEIRMAKKLEIKHLVLHPGSAKGHTKRKGIETLARILNTIFKKEEDITLLLENTAHGKNTVGSNISDFSELKAKLDFPEKLQFCLDFAHAFSYGYNLHNTQEFIGIIDNHMGIENIKLIHFNDSAEPQGCKLDKHAIPGQGFIGESTLKTLINHEKLKHIPIILELPPAEEHVVKEAVEKARKMMSISNMPKIPTNKPMQL